MAKSCYIISGLRFGALSFRAIGGKQQVLFAWQIYRNKRLWQRFDKLDRYYIKQVAQLERHDEWYQRAGEVLVNKGFNYLCNCTEL